MSGKVWLKIIFTVLTIVWMIVIYSFSNQKAIKSTDSSQSFVRSTIIKIYRFFDHDASEEKINNIVEKLDVPVRKLGHLTEFLILGILVMLTLKSYGIDDYKIATLVCFLYSCSDEIHQLFVEGRSGNLIDVIIDVVGSVLGILLIDKVFKIKIK